MTRVSFPRTLRCTTFVIALTLGAGCGAPAGGDHQGGPGAEEYVGEVAEPLQGGAQGFAWITGGAVGTYYSYNSSRGSIWATHDSTGHYHVGFNGLGASGGNAQVVSYGSGNSYCYMSGWANVSGTEEVEVFCFSLAGGVLSNSDSDFVVQYGRAGSSGGSGAYLLLYEGTNGPYLSSSWNATGGTNSFQRGSTGVYAVTLPGLAVYGGSFQVTAVWAGTTASHCKVVNWYPSGSDLIVNVNCFDANGTPANSAFSLNFLANHTASVFGYGAYAWANDATSASYAPSSTYSYDSGIVCSSSGSNSAGRYSTGSYFMRHSLLDPTHSAAFVTAYGSDASYCKVVSWYGYNNGTEVHVNCYGSSGSPVDTRYVETYSSSDVQGPC